MYELRLRKISNQMNRLFILLYFQAKPKTVSSYLLKFNFFQFRFYPLKKKFKVDKIEELLCSYILNLKKFFESPNCSNPYLKLCFRKVPLGLGVLTYDRKK